MTDVLRIAMWSGPRNLSTAMMRSFGNRADVTAVVDEPFYASYLAVTGKPHPMREAVLASQSTNWQDVAEACRTGGDQGVIYQKHMAQHMLPEFSWDWAHDLCNCFLIREPERVAASFLSGWPEGRLEDLGFVQQLALFERISDRLGNAPPVVDATAIRNDPEKILRKLCQAIGISWDSSMLRWPPGLRESDGVWARHWYHSVEHSVSFSAPEKHAPDLTDQAKRLADSARPAYEKLLSYAL